MFHNFPLPQMENRRSRRHFLVNQLGPGLAPCQSWAQPALAPLSHLGVPDLFLCPATRCRTLVCFSQSPAIKAATHGAATTALQTSGSPVKPPQGAPGPAEHPRHTCKRQTHPRVLLGISPRQRGSVCALAEHADLCGVLGRYS